MMDVLDLPFEGKQHSGIDDAHNIARLALTLMRDGIHFTIYDEVHIMWERNYAKYKSLLF